MAGTGLQPLNIFLVTFPFFLSFTIVAIRVWKKIQDGKYAIEDTLLIVAEVILMALTATMLKFILVSYAGYHAEDIPKGAIDPEAVYFWRQTNTILYNPILGFVKISFLITLLKLHCMDRLVTTSLWFLIIVNGIFIVWATLGSLFTCLPVQKSWHRDVPGTCGNRRLHVYGTIGVTIATDVLVSIIPAWVLYKLRMLLKHKVAVIVFLSLPITVTTIGCYRLHKFVEVMKLTSVTRENPYNVRNTLSNLEANIGVIAACGPTIKWLLAKFIPYFDTSPPARVSTIDRLSRCRQRVRDRLRGGNDVEQQLHRLDIMMSSDSKGPQPGNKDSDSQRECMTGDVSSDMQKSTLTKFESHETEMPDQDVDMVSTEPKTSLRPGV